MAVNAGFFILILIAIWLFSKRFKKTYIYLFPVMFLITRLVLIITYTSDEMVMNNEEWNYKKHASL